MQPEASRKSLMVCIGPTSPSSLSSRVLNRPSMALSSSSNQMSWRRKDAAVIQNFICRADQVSIGYSATESVAPPSTGLSFFKLMTTVLAKRRQKRKAIFTDADDWDRYPGTEVRSSSSAGTGRATALQAEWGLRSIAELQSRKDATQGFWGKRKSDLW